MEDISVLLQQAGARLKRILRSWKKTGKLQPGDRLFLLGPAADHLSHDSLAHAAAALDLPKELLRSAKKAGAPGFVGSRVYPDKLLPWLAKWLWETTGLKDASKEALEKKMLQVQIARRELQLDVERNKYIRASEAAAWTTAMISEFVKVLDQVPMSLAPEIVGAPGVAEAEMRIRVALEQAKRMLHQGPWGGEEDVGIKGTKTKGTK